MKGKNRTESCVQTSESLDPSGPKDDMFTEMKYCLSFTHVIFNEFIDDAQVHRKMSFQFFLIK